MTINSMNMRKIFTCTIVLFAVISASAQSLTLNECQALARENHPAIVQRGLIRKASEFTVANAKTTWLPQVEFSAQGTYQSDVTALPDAIEKLLELIRRPVEGIHKDQYKLAVQIEQVIWAGGAVKAQIGIAQAEGEAAGQEWEVGMYALRERVNQLYFGCLLVQERLAEADILIGELMRHDRMVHAYAENGLASGNDLDMIRVEILGAQQKRSELVSMLRAYRTMLGLMVGRELSEQTVLRKPPVQEPRTNDFSARPEIRYFELQERVVDEQRRGLDAMMMPQVGVFVHGAYGYPGLDLFKDMQRYKWTPYIVAGVRLQWAIGGFYTRRNKLSQLELRRGQIASERESFIYNMKLKSTQESIAIDRMREVMRDDEEIISLRGTIRKRTEAGVANETHSVSDLLREISNEDLARQNRLSHEIELLKNIYDLKYTGNN